MSLTLTYGALNLTATPYLIEFGLDTGAPENVTEALAFLLQDGEVELSSRASNRTLQFNVLIEGANLLALATAEAALVAETEKVLNTLTVDPGDSGPATVYEIFRGQVSLVRDDDWEQARVRRYSVTVKALPFPRSAAEVTTAALPTGGTTTTVLSDGSTATGWSGTIDGVSATVVAAAGPPTTVSVTSTALYEWVVVSMTRTISATTSSLKYLIVDWLPAAGTDFVEFTAYGDGIALTRLSDAASPTAGFTRTTFYVVASSVSVLRLDCRSLYGSSHVSPRVRSLTIDAVSISDVTPAFGTPRQLIRRVNIAGSAPAPVSIAIEHASTGLGDLLAYFYQDYAGYAPPLRQYRSSSSTSGVTADPAKYSGSYDSLNGATVIYDIPAAKLPQGSYVVVARMQSGVTTTPTVTWTARARLAGADVGPVYTRAAVFTLDSTTGKMYTLDRITLPTLDLDPATAGLIRITVAATAQCGLDELWLFNTTIGQLVQVACGSSTRLFIEPPSLTTPRPTVRVGTLADRSDSTYPTGAFLAWTMPRILPPGGYVFTAANAPEASVTARYRPRWHTNAAS